MVSIHNDYHGSKVIIKYYTEFKNERCMVYATLDDSIYDLRQNGYDFMFVGSSRRVSDTEYHYYGNQKAPERVPCWDFNAEQIRYNGGVRTLVSLDMIEQFLETINK